MSTYFNTCDYCDNEFLPTRRNIQRFCKPSCRSAHNRIKRREENREQSKLAVPVLKQEEESLFAVPFDIVEEKKTKIEEMSSAGVGNALAANLITEGTKAVLNLFTKEENKLATKGDVTQAMNRILENQNRILKLLEKDDLNSFINSFSQ